MHAYLASCRAHCHTLLSWAPQIPPERHVRFGGVTGGMLIMARSDYTEDEKSALWWPVDLLDKSHEVRDSVWEAQDERKGIFKAQMVSVWDDAGGFFPYLRRIRIMRRLAMARRRHAVKREMQLLWRAGGPKDYTRHLRHLRWSKKQKRLKRLLMREIRLVFIHWKDHQLYVQQGHVTHQMDQDYHLHYHQIHQRRMSALLGGIYERRSSMTLVDRLPFPWIKPFTLLTQPPGPRHELRPHDDVPRAPPPPATASITATTTSRAELVRNRHQHQRSSAPIPIPGSSTMPTSFTTTTPQPAQCDVFKPVHSPPIDKIDGVIHCRRTKDSESRGDDHHGGIIMADDTIVACSPPSTTTPTTSTTTTTTTNPSPQMSTTIIHYERTSMSSRVEPLPSTTTTTHHHPSILKKEVGLGHGNTTSSTNKATPIISSTVHHPSQQQQHQRAPPPPSTKSAPLPPLVHDSKKPLPSPLPLSGNNKESSSWTPLTATGAGHDDDSSTTTMATTTTSSAMMMAISPIHEPLFKARVGYMAASMGLGLMVAAPILAGSSAIVGVALVTGAMVGVAYVIAAYVDRRIHHKRRRYLSNPQTTGTTTTAGGGGGGPPPPGG